MTGLPQTSGIFLCLFLLIFLGSDVSIYQSDCEYVYLCHCVFLCRCICVSLTIIHDRPVSISISDFCPLPLSLTLSHSLSLCLPTYLCKCASRHSGAFFPRSELQKTRDTISFCDFDLQSHSGMRFLQRAFTTDLRARLFSTTPEYKTILKK